MNRAEAVRVITEHREKLKELGVRHLALFGSVVRDEATETSDVDVLVEFEDTVGYFQFMDVQDYLQRALGVPKVDLVLRGSLFEELRDDIVAEAVDVI